MSDGRRAAVVLFLLGFGIEVAVGYAQPGPPPSPVGFTPARRTPVEVSIELTGSVEARRSSLVASEVAGLVVELAVREGDPVAKGQPLVRLRRQHLDLERQRVEADLKEAAARLDLAQRNLDRSRELFASQVLSRQQLDDAVSEHAAWQGRVESLEAQLARVDDDLRQSAVPAPFAGVVVREAVQVGEWLAVGDEVMEVASLDDLEVALEAPERTFSLLRAGRGARVRFEALPGLDLEGTIAAVVPRADPRARTFPVKVRIANPGRRVGVGMLAQVAFAGGEAYPATVVPKDAVVRQGGQEQVFRIDGEQKVEPVEVETGAAVGEWVEVRGRIEPGDRVITRGNERVRPGQAVAGQPVEYPLP